MIDLTTKSGTVIILLIIDAVFFASAMYASVNPAYASVRDKIWELFAGCNGALFLVLNTSHTPFPPPPETLPPVAGL